ncbi:PREDICTED: uncharacterized protein LOC105969253 [Erythranthe guttata]|uniref:uncharacterized protein LOC105969253 n=1 Tax=Erythranthe guttata TaxID=4155 RepID=UPI00064DD5E2|nr:PREDICTED: uncharacterized protein LOC105969253 [Erythranthe guttata]|eukprot:XP_012849454.1 PREDICTED: uncharacterized protein LOC105969253 [Erythranthe guttata]
MVSELLRSMEARNQSDAEFRAEVVETLTRHESNFDKMHNTLQVVLTELRALRASSKAENDVNSFVVGETPLPRQIVEQEACTGERLEPGVIKSQGVAYLNSVDEEFLLSLAFAERLDLGLNRFDLVYTDLKLGIIDFGKLEYGSRTADKKLRKMEKLVSANSSLHAALEGLTEMEVSERRLKQLKERQIELLQKANFDLFNHKLENQRKDVRYFRMISLWSKTFDKSVDLMARFVFLLYARICSVLGQGINPPPIETIKEKLVPHSGPLLTTSKPTMVRFYSRKSLLFFDEDDNGNDGDGGYGADEEKIVKSNKVFHSAGPTTLGGTGLALRYADVI